MRTRSGGVNSCHRTARAAAGSAAEGNALTPMRCRWLRTAPKRQHDQREPNNADRKRLCLQTLLRCRSTHLRFHTVRHTAQHHIVPHRAVPPCTRGTHRNGQLFGTSPAAMWAGVPLPRTHIGLLIGVSGASTGPSRPHTTDGMRSTPSALPPEEPFGCGAKSTPAETACRPARRRTRRRRECLWLPNSP